jgi:hypothetical protein
MDPSLLRMPASFSWTDTLKEIGEVYSAVTGKEKYPWENSIREPLPWSKLIKTL